MLEDRDGNMWLSNGLNKYRINDQKNTYEKLPGLTTSWPSTRDSVAYFNSGMVDTAGDLWMTEYQGVVWKYDGQSLVRYTVKYKEEDALLITIYQDNAGDIWLGSDSAGVYKFNGAAFERFEPTLK